MGSPDALLEVKCGNGSIQVRLLRRPNLNATAVRPRLGSNDSAKEGRTLSHLLSAGFRFAEAKCSVSLG